MTVIPKPTNLDDVLENFGIFKPYHGRLIIFFALAYASNAAYSSNFIFAAQEVAYRCKDDSFANNTCSAVNSNVCTEWVYEKPDSFVGEFQLACQDWRRTLVGTVHSLAYMVGLLFVGPMSDRLGRKAAIVITGVLGGILGLARSFTPWYWMYLVLEFLESAIGDICSPVYVLNVEIIQTKRRVPYYLICALGYSFGGIFLGTTAWLVPYWRDHLRVIYTPALLFFLYIFFIDESPRWLLTRGKREKAIDIIQKMYKKNDLKIDKGVLDNLVCEAEQGVKFSTLLKSTFASKALFTRFIVCVVWWMTSTFVNYGMSINSVSLQGNKYFNYMLISIIEIPANFVIMYILMKFRRKKPLIVCFLTAAVFCIVQPFLPNNLPWLSITTFMAGKFTASVYFSITYMYTSELFPTYTRNSMHALCSSLGRIGSILAPQTPLLRVYWVGLPSLIFGIVSLIAGLVTFIVPDTANDTLPDTVRQAEAIGSKQNMDKPVMISYITPRENGNMNNVTDFKNRSQKEENC